jgi:hypothetical protein
LHLDNAISNYYFVFLFSILCIIFCLREFHIEMSETSLPLRNNYVSITNFFLMISLSLSWTDRAAFNWFIEENIIFVSPLIGPLAVSLLLPFRTIDNDVDG